MSMVCHLWGWLLQGIDVIAKTRCERKHKGEYKSKSKGQDDGGKQLRAAGAKSNGNGIGI